MKTQKKFNLKDHTKSEMNQQIQKLNMELSQLKDKDTETFSYKEITKMSQQIDEWIMHCIS